MEPAPGVHKYIKCNNRIYFLRQLLVCSGVWTTYFMVGQFMGAPTVFVPQLRKDSSIHLDEDMVSWMYSVFGFGAAPWVLLLTYLAKQYGLRIPYMIACVDLLLANLILYFSTTPLQILISELIFGLAHASNLTIGIVIISDYASPKLRGMFLTFKSASFFWGVWFSNAIGTFFHWKYIAISGCLCSLYTFSFIFWPESPQWLASRGRFGECRTAYYWLEGHDEETEKEVDELIASQVNDMKMTRLNNDWSSISDVNKTLRTKEFYSPLLLTILLILQYHFAGKTVCTVYVVDILKKMTSDEWTAYMGMLILDGITVMSTYLGCFLAKILKRRTLYFAATITGIAFLFIISLYVYLVKLTVLDESNILSMVLLTCFTIAMSCGPIIMSTSIYAEIVPLRFKNAMVFIAALLFYICWTGMLKVAPYIFQSFELHGSFLFYGVSSSLCTLLLYKYLPETKDKTLQQIEENFKEKTLPERQRFKLSSEECE